MSRIVASAGESYHRWSGFAARDAGKKDLQALIQQHDPVTVVGVCSMSMIEKAGLPDTVFFDLMIDAMIDLVTVTKKWVRDFF